MDYQKLAEEVRINGLVTLSGVYTREECNRFKKRADEIITEFVAEKKFLIHQNCQYIFSPFRLDPDFFNLLINDPTDNLLKILLDDDYVLIQATMNNRKNRTDIETGHHKSLGDDWHTDSRYLDGRRLDRGFGYLMAVMLDDFTEENGGTHYVPGSHLIRSVPERQGNYKYNVLAGTAGTVVVMDSGMWHRSGPSSNQDRWAVFNVFGPWFMKPYYDYPKMLGPELGATLSKRTRKLLHYTSIPPLNEDERVNTLIRE